MRTNARLNKDPLRKRLHRRRLLSYASLSELGQNTFGRLRYILHVLELYEHVFGKPAQNPVHLGTWDVFPVEEEIVWRLQEEYFPLDIDALNQEYQRENPEPLAGWLPIEAFGLDIYEEYFDYIRAQAQPLVALFGEQLFPPPWSDSDWSDAFDRIDDWWPDDAPPRDGFTWVEGCEAPQELLARLDPPFDGLAAEYRCIVRDDEDNLFFRHAPRGPWDVLVEEEIFWHSDTIDRLADQWREAQPDIERLDAYHEWFDEHDEPVMAVIDVFTDVEEIFREEQQANQEA